MNSHSFSLVLSQLLKRSAVTGSKLPKVISWIVQLKCFQQSTKHSEKKCFLPISWKTSYVLRMEMIWSFFSICIKNELPWDFLKMTENIVLTKEVLHLCRRWISILKCISSQFFFPLSWCLSISIKWFWTSFSQKVIYLIFCDHVQL